MLSPKQTLTLLKQAGADFLEDKAPKLSAALAYYTAFAFAPMLVLGVMALGTVMGGDRDRAEQQVQNQLVQLMGPSGGQAATQLLEQASQQPKGWALAINIALLIFAAGGVFGELQDSLNTIWEVKPKPNAGWWQFIRKRFLSMGEKGIRSEDLQHAIRDEFKENEDLPNTTNPDDWARISGKKGERIVYVRTLLGDGAGGEGRQVERVSAGQYL